MDKEQVLRDVIDKVIEIIEMPEEYIPEYYDTLLEDLEIAYEHDISAQAYAVDLVEESFADPEQIDDIVAAFEKGQLQYKS
jgi:hypothetical protein